MSIEEVLRDHVKERGIPAAELARRVGMNDELLRRSLDGKRPIKSKELVPLCIELNLELKDFADCVSDERKAVK